MSVLIVTSLGDIVVDLFTDKCPLTSKSFLKLCKIKYYNGCLFHTVQKDFTAQTGDPTGTGAGGDSVYKFLYGDQARFFGDEIHLDLKHSKTGTVAMASAGENLNASQFYITLRDDLDYLDGKHTVFGEVAEGLETLTRINEAYLDEKNRPYKNIRIKHTYILDDPFEDPPQLAELIPDASPEGKPKDEVEDEVRLEDDWVPLDEQLGPAELEEVLQSNEAHTRAVVLESIGDIPDAEIKPPENVLFVCKLNPVTEDEDLHTIFSRFGTVTSAEIIRDYKTGDSLCYAFIEFEDKDACERAYFKMDNALIDDRRIHVDFSQSVAKLWYQYRRKDNQRGGGRGCFKCGETDHVAKDCTGGPVSKTQSAKYILKDNNIQRGEDDNSRFEMVFDEDAQISPKEKKERDRLHDGDDYTRRQKMRRSPDDMKHRDRERKDSSERYRESDRNRGHKQDERHHKSRESPCLEEHLGRRKEREYNRRDDQTSRSRSDTERDDRGHARRTTDGDDFVERNEHGDGRRRVGDTRASRRDDTDYKKRGSEGDYRKRAVEDDTSRSELDGRDSKRRHADSDRRDSRDEPSRRKHDSYRERREDDEQRHRGVEKYNRDSRNHDRRHHSDRRR